MAEVAEATTEDAAADSIDAEDKTDEIESVTDAATELEF